MQPQTFDQGEGMGLVYRGLSKKWLEAQSILDIVD